jgi:hypothetical protein
MSNKTEEFLKVLNNPENATVRNDVLAEFQKDILVRELADVLVKEADKLGYKLSAEDFLQYIQSPSDQTIPTGVFIVYSGYLVVN